MPIELAANDPDIQPKLRRKRTPTIVAPSIVTVRFRWHGKRVWDSMSGVSAVVSEGFLTVYSDASTCRAVRLDQIDEYQLTDLRAMMVPPPAMQSASLASPVGPRVYESPLAAAKRLRGEMPEQTPEPVTRVQPAKPTMAAPVRSVITEPDGSQTIENAGFL